MLGIQDRLLRLCVAACSLVLVLAGAANAQNAFPTRPISLVVPFPAGAVTDIVARAIGKELSAKWGQPFVIENVAGANTFLAAERVSRAEPNGYTLLFAADITLSINPLLLSKLPYDPDKDFAPVSAAVVTSPVLLVNPSLPVNSVSELIAYAKKNPGKLNYASFGPGTQPHLAAETLKVITGAEMVHIPYKGAAPAVVDLVAGHVQVLFASVASVRTFLESGKLRALAVAGPNRLPIIPNVPTFAESGFPNFEARGWFGVVAPANTPQSIVAKLSQGISETVKSDSFRNTYLIPSGLEAIGNTPEEFAVFLKRDREQWAEKIDRVRGELQKN